VGKYLPTRVAISKTQKAGARAEKTGKKLASGLKKLAKNWQIKNQAKIHKIIRSSFIYHTFHYI
jgi:hypothetical protein